MDEQKKKPRWWAELLRDADHWTFQHPGGALIIQLMCIAISVICIAISGTKLLR